MVGWSDCISGIAAWLLWLMLLVLMVCALLPCTYSKQNLIDNISLLPHIMLGISMCPCFSAGFPICKKVTFSKEGLALALF